MEWKTEIEKCLIFAILVDDMYFKDVINFEKFCYAVYVKKSILLFIYDKSFLPVGLVLKKIDRLKIVEAKYEDIMSPDFVKDEVEQFVFDLLQPVPEHCQIN